MEDFRESLVVVISVPVYVIVIGTEMLLSHLHERHFYSRKGILSNMYLTALNLSLDVVVRGVSLFILYFFYTQRFGTWIGSKALYWTLLVVAEDFLYYWLHRVDHYCRLFWAVHVTHHSSEEFNLTVGFRSSVLQPLYRFLYFIPLALMGFHPLDILLVYSITQSFGVLVHTQSVGKLGWLEYLFVTPSHHRVHHACNVQYLDRNMGMLLIIWDKLFGTFQPELDDVPVRFGITHPLQTYHPLKVIFHEWQDMAADLKKPCTIGDKLHYVFGPPGWSHDGSRKTSRQLREEQAPD
jgi:sterol desaturase/sphingolipid hydroxylase (fatty acid hydroxylase superfamily)